MAASESLGTKWIYPNAVK
uniref:Uncharacterized protein n=1 Tax=Rhizophora mucronata TaxID=61149 RepID=A0A2P2J7U3_RHIMU